MEKFRLLKILDYITATDRCIQENVITHRELSCFCKSCITCEGVCQNEHLIGKWIVSNLQNRQRRGQNLHINDRADDDGEANGNGDGGEADCW